MMCLKPSKTFLLRKQIHHRRLFPLPPKWKHIAMIALLLGSETHLYAFRNAGVGVIFHYIFTKSSAGNFKTHFAIIKNFPLSGQIIKNVTP